MSTTIIFGTKKLGQTAAPISKEKYPNQAVITVEGQKGPKKSRRILLNTKAAELLNCELGSVQNLVFASVEMGSDAPNQVLIANANTIDGDVNVTYKTSKNKVSYGEDSSEKGKAITSSHACSEVFRFLGLDDSANVEFEISAFDNDSIDAFVLGTVSEYTAQATEPAIETNNGEVTTEEVVNETMAEVQRAEENDPIMDASPNEFESLQEEPPVLDQVAETEAELESEWS